MHLFDLEDGDLKATASSASQVLPTIKGQRGWVPPSGLRKIKWPVNGG